MTLLRTESFVPLTAAPAAGSQREFHVTVIPKEGQTRPFQSLEKPATSFGGDSLSSSDKKLCEPRISVQREGDRVTGIRVHCTCGQVMELACLYEGAMKGV